MLLEEYRSREGEEYEFSDSDRRTGRSRKKYSGEGGGT
jgi:hypothetical protein